MHPTRHIMTCTTPGWSILASPSLQGDDLYVFGWVGSPLFYLNQALNQILSENCEPNVIDPFYVMYFVSSGAYFLCCSSLMLALTVQSGEQDSLGKNLNLPPKWPSLRTVMVLPRRCRNKPDQQLLRPC